MSTTVPILYQTWDWCAPRPARADADHIVLWHGCTGNDVTRIMVYGVDPAVGRPDTDFGRGFYLTSVRRQARQWAWHRYYSLPPTDRGGGNTPIILRFRLRRDVLSKLESLQFVLGDYDNEDFWSLVHHCRQSVAADPAGGVTERIHNHKCNQHAGPTRDGWYDIVVGPVAAFWDQRVAMLGADQVGFHTPNAATVLNDLIFAAPRDRAAFRVEAI